MSIIDCTHRDKTIIACLSMQFNVRLSTPLVRAGDRNEGKDSGGQAPTEHGWLQFHVPRSIAGNGKQNRIARVAIPAYNREFTIPVDLPLDTDCPVFVTWFASLFDKGVNSRYLGTVASGSLYARDMRGQSNKVPLVTISDVTVGTLELSPSGKEKTRLSPFRSREFDLSKLRPLKSLPEVAAFNKQINNTYNIATRSFVWSGLGRRNFCVTPSPYGMMPMCAFMLAGAPLSAGVQVVDLEKNYHARLCVAFSDRMHVTVSKSDWDMRAFVKLDSTVICDLICAIMSIGARAMPYVADQTFDADGEREGTDEWQLVPLLFDVYRSHSSKGDVPPPGGDCEDLAIQSCNEFDLFRRVGHAFTSPHLAFLWQVSQQLEFCLAVGSLKFRSLHDTLDHFTFHAFCIAVHKRWLLKQIIKGGFKPEAVVSAYKELPRSKHLPAGVIELTSVVSPILREQCVRSKQSLQKEEDTFNRLCSVSDLARVRAPSALVHRDDLYPVTRVLMSPSLTRDFGIAQVNVCCKPGRSGPPEVGAHTRDLVTYDPHNRLIFETSPMTVELKAACDTLIDCFPVVLASDSLPISSSKVALSTDPQFPPRQAKATWEMPKSNWSECKRDIEQYASENDYRLTIQDTEVGPGMELRQVSAS